jgi:hypothetical protein
MARGRFISSAIITDRQIHDLSSDTCRLAYTWVISLADREGRVVGEPDLLLAQLFPRRLGEITSDDIEGFIREWVQAGFVIWYEGKDGDRVLQLVNFEKHQVGLRKERETASSFDKPEDCRIIDGELPEQSPVNVKLSKDKLSNPKTDLFDSCKQIYEQKKGLLVTDGQAFTQMINNFKKAGVTADDYAAAISAMDADPKYKGTKPTSYEKWAIGYAENRSADNNNGSAPSKNNATYKANDGNIYNAYGEVVGTWKK